jgi:hypothetical protein
MTEDLVEGEIVEDLDQLWVGNRQRGDVTGEKLKLLVEFYRLAHFLGMSRIHPQRNRLRPSAL